MYYLYIEYADVAQLAEQLTCNQQVNGSSPFIGLFLYGWVPEWPKGADCKSVAIASKVRILPHPFLYDSAEWSSSVARRAHNPKVTGSNPVSAI